jgi:hypothetical protein
VRNKVEILIDGYYTQIFGDFWAVVRSDLFSSHQDPSRIELIGSGKYFDQSRLTGSILAQERVDFSLAEIKVYLFQYFDPIE